MSRVAKNPIVLPKGVEATLGTNGITVKGAKGTLSAAIHPDVPVAVENGEIVVTGRRAALARWLTTRDTKPSSLLARVTMNRVWQSHFGSGIVATPENLGMVHKAAFMLKIEELA